MYVNNDTKFKVKCKGVSRSIHVLVQMYMYVLLVKEDVFSWE